MMGKYGGNNQIIGNQGIDNLAIELAWKMRRPSRTDPQRASSCCRCFLPDLTGFTGVRRAGPDPGDTLVPLQWKRVTWSQGISGRPLKQKTIGGGIETKGITSGIHALRPSGRR